MSAEFLKNIQRMSATGRSGDVVSFSRNFTIFLV